ncbi:MAG: terminase large subunit domain-containing protein [bacterium]
MELKESDIKEKYVNVLTSKKVDEILDKQNKGYKITLSEKIWFKGQVGVRKPGLQFAMTKEELDEYSKCKMNIHYFAEKYCKIKREDGTIGPMTLRDYQKDIIDLFTQNNYSILMASRQTGKTISAAITILHFSLFNKDKGTMIVANKGATVVEIVDKIKNIYKLLPFFLKKGIVNWNQSSIVFDNGCRIKTDKRTKEPAIGFTIDFLYIDEFAHIPNNIIEDYYTAVVPIISSVNNPRFVITSTPKGINLFHKMLIGAELSEDDPNWNGFRAMRVYWWQIKGRRDIKIFLNDASLRKYNISKKEIIKFLLEKGYKIYEKEENKKNGIFIEHDSSNNETDIEFVRNLRYETLPLSELGVITNWCEQQIKIIGGEDNFKQEYDLHFLIGGNMLFDSVTIEKLNENNQKFEYVDIPDFTKMLKYPYNGLKFITKKELFNLEEAKKYQIFISVDLSEGLGNDYSVINIFRLLPKTDDEIKYYKKRLTDTLDFFKLEQIGIFKSNIYSVKEVAHILYLIAFVLFDDSKVKIILERNTYGDELLAHMPHVFNENNNFSNHIFVRYKQRVEDKGTKMGIKINRNKKLLVKDFQSNTKKGNIVIHEHSTITEMSTFTKHETPSGDITYKAESGHDDCIMTTIILSSVFSNISYKDAIDMLVDTMGGSITDIIKSDILSQYQDDQPDLNTVGSAYKKVYSQGVLNKPNQMNPFKNSDNGFNGSRFNRPGFNKQSFPQKSPFDRN